jgi:hypothetical protein
MWNLIVGFVLVHLALSGFRRREDAFTFTLFYENLINFVISIRFPKIMPK